MSHTPSHEDIARRAYDIYTRKGQLQGQCGQNWQQAEAELLKPPAKPAKGTAK